MADVNALMKLGQTQVCLLMTNLTGYVVSNNIDTRVNYL